MTTITLPRATVEQALEALDEADTFHRNLPDQRARRLAAMAALCAALAQQAEAAQDQDVEDAIEAAYWQFDCRKNGLNEWASAPQSERDAFKAEARKLVRGYFPTRQAQDTKREMLAVADAFIRGKRAALAQQDEPVRSPSTPQEKEMTDPNSVCFSLNTGAFPGAFPVEVFRLDGSGFHYKGKVIEDAGEAYNLFKQWLVMAQQPSQEAEPVAGKVVAWGVFANIDGEWQLQHPVFAGDEQGKVNAEFERASYSGPQPLEVRPLGVVTATAQQAEPAQEPVAWECRAGGLKPLTQRQYDAQTVATKRHYTRIAPPQRKLVLLTAQELDGVIERHVGGSEITDDMYTSMEQFARAIEKASWEKNHG